MSIQELLLKNIEEALQTTETAAMRYTSRFGSPEAELLLQKIEGCEQALRELRALPKW